ncbi:LysR family transcriptional regulator [Arenibacter sp. 6A1]|uniref:LysR family transcriptional regulator n=1 Tax=Arenibacter sp. 6A1 TaxID=2720391 RepID=UPI0014472AD2|nr:LysR family transcriptional regulator [Arenibacter sp. 6A1]NKI26777.1 LysR family transcriptional regulator [Arenibacter sp. 6A1]
MFDFRLKVFHTVAKRLSFTKAAKELFITQPAVTKHIKEIENYLNIKVFERKGSQILLTPAGKILLDHTEALFSIYRELEFELNTITKNYNGRLRIGASTTIAQYILPQLLAGFHQKFGHIKVSLINGNTEKIEAELQANTIDLGIIEGKTKKSNFKYEEFIKDEIVLVANSQHPLVKKQPISLETLKTVPILLREQGSGTLEVIDHHLKNTALKTSDLSLEMELGSTESIKNYLYHSNSVAFLSIHSVFKELKNNDFSILDVADLNIGRHFYFIQPQGQTDPLSELFKKFALHYNFK